MSNILHNNQDFRLDRLTSPSESLKVTAMEQLELEFIYITYCLFCERVGR